MGDNWTLRTICLDIVYFPHPHTGEALAERIKEILKEWGIENKIIAITTDNGPNIILAGKILAGRSKINNNIPSVIPFYNRCVAHTIQRIVLHGMDEGLFKIDGHELSVKKYVDKIR
jgi:hypothetical protein